MAIQCPMMRQSIGTACNGFRMAQIGSEWIYPMYGTIIVQIGNNIIVQLLYKPFYRYIQNCVQLY